MSEIRSRPQTAEYDEGHARTFGERPQNVRGRWIWDDAAGKLVRAEDYVPPSQAINAPIIADRIHEGTVSPIDGTDIGSRRKRREHMRVHGVEDATDVSPEYRARVARERDRDDRRALRSDMESAARKLYQQGRFR